MMFFHPKQNRTASLVAAAALCELFPGIRLLARGLSPVGFSIEFDSSYKLPSEAEVLLEDKMRSIIKEKRDLVLSEMVPVSAREFLRSLGLFFREDEDREEGLVEIARLDPFADQNEGSLCQSIQELNAFKLFPLEKGEEGQFFLRGVSFSSKEELKQFLKAWKHYRERSHFEMGLKLGYWLLVEDQLVWKSLGVEVFDRFSKEVETLFFEGVERIRLGFRKALTSIQKKYSFFGEKVFYPHEEAWDAEVGLLKALGGCQLELFLSGNDPEFKLKLISSLQRIGKTLSILGFDYHLLLQVGARSFKELEEVLAFAEREGVVLQREKEGDSSFLHFLSQDALGRKWALFSVQWGRKEIKIFGSLERLFALSLENEKTRMKVRDIENQ